MVLKSLHWMCNHIKAAQNRGILHSLKVNLASEGLGRTCRTQQGLAQRRVSLTQDRSHNRGNCKRDRAKRPAKSLEKGMGNGFYLHNSWSSESQEVRQQEDSKSATSPKATSITFWLKFTVDGAWNCHRTACLESCPRPLHATISPHPMNGVTLISCGPCS